MRDELAANPAISQVELSNARPYEISVEISERALRRHGLSFDFVARAVRRSSLDLPGGTIKTDSGEILLDEHDGAFLRDDGTDDTQFMVGLDAVLLF